MRAGFKLVLCLVCFAVYLVVLCVMRLFFFLLPQGKHNKALAFISHIFALCLKGIMGLRIHVIGKKPAAGGKGMLLVSNHLGYLDGFALGSVFPLIYTSKSELKGWPVIGAMTYLSGTIFLERQRKNNIGSYIEKMAFVLKQGVNVLFFPEGTSTNGEGLLAFKSAFFAAPILAGSSVLPISLLYTAVNGKPLTTLNKDRLYWYGDMTFFGHFLKLLSQRSIDMEVHLHDEIPSGDRLQNEFLRKDLSEQAYRAISSKLPLRNL